MKKITKTIVALSVLAAVASCAKEISPVNSNSDNNGGIALTLTAGQEGVETRAAAGETVTDENGKKATPVLWTADDGLSVFEVGSATNNQFTLTDGAGTDNGKFSGTVSSTATSLIVIHPYSSSMSLSGLSVTGVELKTEQTATAGSFDPATALMAGVIPGTTTQKSVTLNNVVGYVKICPQFDCQKITLESKSANDILSGPVSATYDSGALSFTSTGTGSSNKVSISGDIKNGKVYYIAVLPVEMESGFKLIFTMKDGTEKYLDGTKALSITKNRVWNLGTWKEDDDAMMVDYEDLSTTESANCYLIKKAGYYKFKAVQGNSTTSVGTVNSVEVLWESDGTATAPAVGALIAKVSCCTEGGVQYIRFSTPDTFSQGNAVIAAKDASGTILWSWHIWCASEGWKEQVYWTNGAHETALGTMMDRNIGATSATIDDASSMGLLYQWGRKDPFLGAASFGTVTRAVSTNSTSWGSSSETMSADNTTKNPMTFYLGRENGMPDGSWASDKQKYDPCPAGWKVPEGGESGIWYKANNDPQIESGMDGYDDDDSESKQTVAYGVNCGGVFGSAATIWYPATGSISYVDFTLSDYEVGISAWYWSSTVSPNSWGWPHAYCCYINVSGYDNNYSYMIDASSSADYFRAAGSPVRCQKE